MALFTFARSIYLFLLVLVPVLIFIHFVILRRKRSHALSFANFDAIARVKGIDIISKNLSSLILTAIILVLLILALSGLTYHRNLFASSFAFTIAIDASRSMEADDFLPNRLEVAKQTAMAFVDSSPPGSKMAVISFAGNAFIEQDLTEQKPFIKQAIKNIQISSVGGTDINEAVITGTNLLRDSEAKSIIILSDGALNVGSIDDAIDYATKNNIIVHVIGIGTVEGGSTTYGGLSKLDEDVLKSMAFNTGGQYFEVENREQLEESFRTVLGLKLGKVGFDLTHYLLLITLVLFVVEYVLTNTRYRVFP